MAKNEVVATPCASQASPTSPCCQQAVGVGCPCFRTRFRTHSWHVDMATLATELRKPAALLFGPNFGASMASRHGCCDSREREGEGQGPSAESAPRLPLQDALRTPSSALQVLSTPNLEPGKAFQAAKNIANLALQEAARSELATKPALDTMLRALLDYREETSSHMPIAFARIAADSRLARILRAHAGFCSTMLEHAEWPACSKTAGRALALCAHELPLADCDDARVLAVLRRLLMSDQTELQTDALRAFARFSRSSYGIQRLSEQGVWCTMLGGNCRDLHAGVFRFCR